MTEETTNQVAPQPSEGQPAAVPSESATPAEVSPTPAVETPPSWRDELDKVDASEILKHPKLRGIIGSEAQRLYANKSEKEAADLERKRLDSEEKAFLDLVEGNTDYIKQHHPAVYEQYERVQKDRATRELGSVKQNTVHELATNIGRALADVPEWKELQASDHETLAKAVMGKPDDEVLPIFNRMAIDLVAERRATKRFEEMKAKELAKEREVIRQEEAAKLLAKTEAPEGKKGKNGRAKVDISGMSDQDFEQYWKTLRG